MSASAAAAPFSSPLTLHTAATGYSDHDGSSDESAFARPAVLFVPPEPSPSAASTQIFTPLHAVTPGKATFKPKLSLAFSEPASDAADDAPVPASVAADAVDAAPSLLPAEPPRRRSGVVHKVSNTTFRTEDFEIRQSSFSRRASATANSPPAVAAAASSGSSSSSKSATPSQSCPSTPPICLSAFSSSTLTEVRVLGKGASGTVLLCHHAPSDSLVAVKVISVHDRAKRQQLIQELQGYSGERQLDSPYVVRFLGAFYEQGSVRLGLEYMDRGSLQSVLQQCGGLREELVCDVTRQALLALHHLHSHRLLHRDVKPGNFLLNSSGQVKLSDLGLLAELHNTLAAAQTFVGTMIYFSPERLQSESYGTPADVWSLGLTVIALRTGANPLAEEAANGGYFSCLHALTHGWQYDLGPDCSQHMHDFVQRCLQVEPDQRWTAEQLLQHPWILEGQQRDSQALLQLWPDSLNMGGAGGEAAAAMQGGELKVDAASLGQWRRKSGGLQKIHDMIAQNAKKERSTRQRQGSLNAGEGKTAAPADSGQDTPPAAAAAASSLLIAQPSQS
jgi:hypothetical protein